jgi:hypothetical protein
MSTRRPNEAFEANRARERAAVTPVPGPSGLEFAAYFEFCKRMYQELGYRPHAVLGGGSRKPETESLFDSSRARTLRLQIGWSCASFESKHGELGMK